jgi:DNA-binding MurR/RpiR family transcriptional regulator
MRTDDDGLTHRLRCVLRVYASHRDAVPLTVSEVSDRLGVARSTVVRQCQRLGQCGYLHRRFTRTPWRATPEGVAAATRQPPISPNGKAARK